MKNYVTSYHNPDLDGIACMIAMANLRAQSRPGLVPRSLGEGKWVVVRFGAIDFESQFILEKLRLPAPRAVSDLSDAGAIILVDTHHKLQLPRDFPSDKVIQIIDHHPNGDDAAFPNAEIINQTTGAAASIVANMYLDAGIWDEKILRLLAFAIISNTQEFTNSTASDFDRNVYAKILEKYPISDNEISDMMASRLKILEVGLRTAIESDVKVFDTKFGKIGVAQLKMPGLFSALDLDETEKELAIVAHDMELEYFLLNAGDTKIKQSVVITANAKTAEIIGNHLGVKFENNRHVFDRLLLRKKDFVFDQGK